MGCESLVYRTRNFKVSRRNVNHKAGILLDHTERSDTRVVRCLFIYRSNDGELVRLSATRFYFSRIPWLAVVKRIKYKSPKALEYKLERLGAVILNITKVFGQHTPENFSGVAEMSARIAPDRFRFIFVAKEHTPYICTFCANQYVVVRAAPTPHILWVAGGVGRGGGAQTPHVGPKRPTWRAWTCVCLRSS